MFLRLEGNRVRPGLARCGALDAVDQALRPAGGSGGNGGFPGVASGGVCDRADDCAGWRVEFVRGRPIGGLRPIVASPGATSGSRTRRIAGFPRLACITETNLMTVSFVHSRATELPIKVPAIGLELFVRLPPDATGGDFCFIETINAPGKGPPQHRHPQAEIFRVIEGRYLYQVDGRRFFAEPGDAVSIPGRRSARLRQCDRCARPPVYHHCASS